MPKIGPKGGSPPGRGPGEGSEGGKRHQNGTDGAPKSAFQTSAEAGKVMKYSIFSVHETESLLEWGAAHAVRHGLRFSCVMGGGESPGGFVLRLSVCLSQKSDGKTGFLEPEKHSFCSLALQNSEFWLAKISASCAAPELAKDNFISPNTCVSAAEWRRLSRGTLCAIYAKKWPKRGVPPGQGPQGGAPGAANGLKSAPRKPPKAPSRPARRLEK